MSTSPSIIRQTLDTAIESGIIWTWDSIFDAQNDILLNVFMPEYKKICNDRLVILAARTRAKYGDPEFRDHHIDPE